MVALSLLRRENLKKDNYKHVGVIRDRPPTWLFIISSRVQRRWGDKKRLHLRMKEGRSNGREGGKNLDNPSLLLEVTARCVSHGDRNPLTRPILTPPLSIIGSFLWLNATSDPRRSKSTT